MEQIKALFGNDYRLATLILMTAAFLVGVIVEMILAKVFGGGAADDRARFQTRRDTRRFDTRKTERRHPAPADGSVEIYVGNLSYDLAEDQLRKEFEAFGKVNSARIVVNRYNNKSKGFGFVHMPNRPEAEAAIKALNGKDILGRSLTCNEARNLV